MQRRGLELGARIRRRRVDLEEVAPGIGSGDLEVPVVRAAQRFQAPTQGELIGKPALSFLRITCRKQGVNFKHLGTQITGNEGASTIRVTRGNAHAPGCGWLPKPASIDLPLTTLRPK